MGSTHLVAVCSGTIAAPLGVGNGSTGAASGPGLTIRCNNPYGGPSNIVVSYNHLDAVSLGLSDGINPLEEGARVRAGQSLNVRVHQQPLDARDRTSIRIYPHLHLEVLYTPSTAGGVTVNALRLNPAYFFTPQALEEFTGIMNPYYSVDDDTDPDNILQFEWEPYDTSDAPAPLQAGIREGQEPDTDLGIRTADNTRFYVSGDVRPAVVGVPDLWARTDRGGIQNLETETIDIPIDGASAPVLYADLRSLLLILLGM